MYVLKVKTFAKTCWRSSILPRIQTWSCRSWSSASARSYPVWWWGLRGCRTGRTPAGSLAKAWCCPTWSHACQRWPWSHACTPPRWDGWRWRSAGGIKRVGGIGEFDPERKTQWERNDGRGERKETRGGDGRKYSEMTHFLYCEKPTQQTDIHPRTPTHARTHTHKPVTNEEQMCFHIKTHISTFVHMQPYSLALPWPGHVHKPCNTDLLQVATIVPPKETFHLLFKKRSVLLMHFNNKKWLNAQTDGSFPSLNILSFTGIPP